MLFVLFKLDNDRYVLDAAQVIEVLPFVRATPIAHAPPEIPGAFTYRGAAVPVVDMSRLLVGRPAHHRLSTRIILARYPAQTGERALGLIAENALGTFVSEPALFQSSGITSERAPYLGPVVSDAGGLIQWIEIDRLLPAEVAHMLFQPEIQPV